MGYNPTPQLVHEYEDILETIYQYLKSDAEVPLQLEVVRLEEVYKEQYRLRRALKAADVFRKEKGGRYAGIGRLIEVAVDPENSRLLISAKGLAAKNKQEALRQVRRDEYDVIQSLKNFKGSMPFETFYPSSDFDEVQFRQETKQMGWELLRIMPTDNDDEMMVTFEKIEIARETGVESPLTMFKKAANQRRQQ